MPYFRPEEETNGKRKRVTVRTLGRMKRRGEKIPVLTAYDYPTARILDAAGVPVLLVGDSLGMVVLGYDSTIPVTVDDMIHHARAVCRGAERALVVVDMPFMSYRVSKEETLRNAGRMIQESGAHAVKLEGGADVAPVVEKLVTAGIPVMGHIGLTPQSINTLGGYRIVGKTSRTAERLMVDAKALQEAGAFSIVLEGVPSQVAEAISKRLSVPTIGIGAGAGCDGQVQVIHDILGMFEGKPPRHARVYSDTAEIKRQAVEEYLNDVTHGRFPTKDESFEMSKETFEEFRAFLKAYDEGNS